MNGAPSALVDRPPPFLGGAGAYVLAALVIAGAAAAQTRPVAKADPFAVTTWFELKPPSLERVPTPGPARPGGLDITVQEDPNDIYVYGRKKKIEPREWQRQDFSNPHYLDAFGPLDRIQPPRTNCAAASYNTVAGQAATGRDLAGVVGAGGGC